MQIKKYGHIRSPQGKEKAMSTMNSTTSAPFGAIAIYHTINAVETVLNNLSTWNKKRKLNKQLNALSAHGLDDIGLAYADAKNLYTGLYH